jgi:chemosensory pili system protein ChpA (sensor histidine kinase/response regulator)
LVTSHAVLVRVGQDLFAVPTNSLSQILASGTGKFRTLGNEVTYQLGKDIYPTASLASLVGVADQKSLAIDASRTVLLVRADDGLVAITVDYAVGSFDLVVKGTGSYVNSLTGVSGVSILGDGNVVSVLNVPELLQGASGNAVAAPAKGSSTVVPFVAPQLPRVLIVDDSLSVRKSLSQLVGDVGYEISVAQDGLEAVEILRKQGADLVLTDLEMPRMTGLELTSHIRANTELQNLPVIMITSRSLQKHRDHAARIGVNRYINKPFSEDELLGEIESLLKVGSV